MNSVAQQLAEEQTWVLGVTEPKKDAVAAIRGGEPLLDEVRRIYLNEYASRWDAFIADIRLVPMSGGLTQLIQTARLISSADSPLPPLMRGMARETTLLSPDGKNVIDKTTDRATGVLKDVREAIAGKVAARPHRRPADREHRRRPLHRTAPLRDRRRRAAARRRSTTRSPSSARCRSC